jgi:hypothetical protein
MSQAGTSGGSIQGSGRPDAAWRGSMGGAMRLPERVARTLGWPGPPS